MHVEFVIEFTQRVKDAMLRRNEPLVKHTLLINLGCASGTNYFMSIHVNQLDVKSKDIILNVQLIKIIEGLFHVK